MPFKRFIQTGRVVYIVDGQFKGKTCCVVDCVDQKSVLVDGPETGVPRQKIRLSQLHLTKFRINFPFHAPTRVVRAAWKQGNLDEKWAKSRWAEKAANRLRRLELSDFDRFRLKRARTTRNKIRTTEYQRLLKRVFYPVKKANRYKMKKKAAEGKTKVAKSAKSKKETKSK